MVRNEQRRGHLAPLERTIWRTTTRCAPTRQAEPLTPCRFPRLPFQSQVHLGVSSGCDVHNHLSLFLCVADYDKLLPGEFYAMSGSRQPSRDDDFSRRGVACLPPSPRQQPTPSSQAHPLAPFFLSGWSHFAQFAIAVVNKDPKKSKYSDTYIASAEEHGWGGRSSRCI